MRPWDEGKNELNKHDHRISFETAQNVFDDYFAVTFEDYLDENGEMRYQTIGAIDGVLIFVAHVYRFYNDVEIPWLISARKAINNEEKLYWFAQRNS